MWAGGPKLTHASVRHQIFFVAARLQAKAELNINIIAAKAGLNKRFESPHLALQANAELGMWVHEDDDTGISPTQ